ncbi:MAG: D-alanyl-D-alanine carboxypeptidase [Acidobacteriaceae bacterium]
MWICFFAAVCGGLDGCNTGGGGSVPADIRAEFNKRIYKNATWGLRVVDSSGKVLIDYNPRYHFFIASTRKIFTVGELLDEVGPNHTYDTAVYSQATIDLSLWTPA